MSQMHQISADDADADSGAARPGAKIRPVDYIEVFADNLGSN